MLEIKDAVAVITGGAGGIGLALARYWRDRGGRLLIADISEEALERARVELGLGIQTMVIDVTREDDCAKLADTAIQTFGQINLVAPFAGIIRDGLMVVTDKETGKVTGKLSLEDFRKVIDINLTGVFLTVRECTERMITSGSRGLICLISSVSSQGKPGQINYTSAKAAMAVMPRVLTGEFFRRGLSERIRCVAVAPGLVGTEMVRGMNQKALTRMLGNVPIGRLIEPEEVASLIGEAYRNEALAGATFFIHGGV